MKTIFLILFMGIMAYTVNAVQPARKPFLQIKVDGKSIKNGDILTVNPGQKLSISVDLEGGRRDFCKFPDTYADIVGASQILSRGDNGLTYLIGDVRSEWKLKNEDFNFSSDEYIKIKSVSGQRTAELTVSNAKFSQSFVKVTVKSYWQFIQDGKTSMEENQADATIYFKIEGSSDVWYNSKNIRASGIKNELIQERLNAVQLKCDSIEKDFHRLNFGAIQQGIRNLQVTMTALKEKIEEVKTSNPSYQTSILFLGLPSDDPYADIESFTGIKSNWGAQEALINDIKTTMDNLTDQATGDHKNQLLTVILQYSNWLSSLPEGTNKDLSDYLPEINPESVRLPGNIASVASAKMIADYPKTFADFKTFIDLRAEQVVNEVQSINSIQSRLQAVRLFDGMLRSYFSSLTWAEWESKRGF